MSDADASDAPAQAGTLAPPKHEQLDVPVRVIALFCSGMGLAVLMMGGIAAWLYPGEAWRQTLRDSLPTIQAPALQQDPAADMAAFRSAQLAQLASLGWVDRPRGVVGIPVDQAMADVAREGIPGWPR